MLHFSRRFNIYKDILIVCFFFCESEELNFWRLSQNILASYFKELVLHALIRENRTECFDSISVALLGGIRDVK